MGRSRLRSTRSPATLIGDHARCLPCQHPKWLVGIGSPPSPKSRNAAFNFVSCSGYLVMVSVGGGLSYAFRVQVHNPRWIMTFTQKRLSLSVNFIGLHSLICVPAVRYQTRSATSDPNRSAGGLGG